MHSGSHDPASQNKGRNNKRRKLCDVHLGDVKRKSVSVTFLWFARRAMTIQLSTQESKAAWDIICSRNDMQLARANAILLAMLGTTARASP